MWIYFEKTGKAIDTDDCYCLRTVATRDNKCAVVYSPLFVEDVPKEKRAEFWQYFDDKESAKAYIKNMVEKLNREGNSNV